MLVTLTPSLHKHFNGKKSRNVILRLCLFTHERLINFKQMRAYFFASRPEIPSKNEESGVATVIFLPVVLVQLDSLDLN